MISDANVLSLRDRLESVLKRKNMWERVTQNNLSQVNYTLSYALEKIV